MTERAIKARISEIQDYPTLTQWSRGFCESIVDQIDRGRRLSEKQMEVLTRIFNENTPEQVAKLNAWPEEYNKNWSQWADVLAYYYQHNPPYFRDLVSDIQNGVVPPRHAFMKMVSNKFAQKVIAEAKKQPKYKIGDYMLGNAACTSRDLTAVDSGRLGPRALKDFRLRGGFVMAITNYVVSAAKGSKRYKILPVGSTVAFWVEERRLKKAPKPKKS